MLSTGLHFASESTGLALSAKAKRRNTIAISRDGVRAKPLPNDRLCWA